MLEFASHVVVMLKVYLLSAEELFSNGRETHICASKLGNRQKTNFSCLLFSNTTKEQYELRLAQLTNTFLHKIRCE